MLKPQQLRQGRYARTEEQRGKSERHNHYPYIIIDHKLFDDLFKYVIFYIIHILDHYFLYVQYNKQH
jgi:hypothetical protein